MVAAVGIAHATAAAQAQGLRLLRLLGRIPFGQFGHTEQELLQKIEDEMVSFGPGGSVLHHLLWPARKHLLRITSTPACPACGHLARPHTQIDELPPRIFISEPEIRAASGNPFAALLSQLNNVHVQAHQRECASCTKCHEFELRLHTSVATCGAPAFIALELPDVSSHTLTCTRRASRSLVRFVARAL